MGCPLYKQLGPLIAYMVIGERERAWLYTSRICLTEARQASSFRRAGRGYK